jgi:FKBP-type peptidyl-prolyl cis-trans isomerase (trigger factor)
VIEKRFGARIQEVFREQAVRRLFRDTAGEQDLGPVGFVEAQDVTGAKGTDLSFTAEFDVAPDIALPTYADFRAVKGCAGEEAKDALSDFLLANTAFDIPASLVNEELRGDDDLGNSDDANEEQRQAAEKRVRLLLILRQIAEADCIEVDDRDVDERIARPWPRVMALAPKLCVPSFSKGTGLTG